MARRSRPCNWICRRRTEDLRELEIGTVVYLTGRVFTAREGVYKRAIEDGAGMPASRRRSGHCQFSLLAGGDRSNADGSFTVGAVTATASFRFAKWLDGWFKLSGCNIIIGKGGMTSEVYRRLVRAEQGDLSHHGRLWHRRAARPRHQAASPASTGSKNSAWPKRSGCSTSRNSARSWWRAISPAISLFERENAKIAPGLAKLYEGTRPATLRRYGETDDKTEEVI